MPRIETPLCAEMNGCEARPVVDFWDAASGRVSASPVDTELTPEGAFRGGGQHTGDRNPLRHWRIGVDVVPESTAESLLGREFDV